MPSNALLAGSLTSALLANAVDPAAASFADSGARLSHLPQQIRPAPAPSVPPCSPAYANPVAIDAGAPVWKSRLATNARLLSELTAGWDGPRSIPISQEALSRATTYVGTALDSFADVNAPRLVPGGDGSVQIEWHTKHGELELDIYPDGEMSIWIKDHGNGAEFSGENEAALALFYRWAPWVAARSRDDFNVLGQAQMPAFSVAA